MAPPDRQGLPFSPPHPSGLSPLSFFSLDHAGFLAYGMCLPVTSRTKGSQESRVRKCLLPSVSSGMLPGALGARCLAGSRPKLVLAGDRGVGLWGAGAAAAAVSLIIC